MRKKNQDEHDQDNIKNENDNNVNSMNFRTNEPVKRIQECGGKQFPDEWIFGVDLGVNQGTSERRVK